MTTYTAPSVSPVYAEMEQLLAQRIVIIDGAMGTMIQRHKLTDAEYRGEEFATHHKDLKGNNDLLNLTQPHVIRGIHKAYLDAGADIVETNTFNAQAISLADYDMSHLARRINLAAVTLAKEACKQSESETGKRRYVAGAIGPLNRTASISPSVDRPDYRNVTWDEMVAAYTTQAQAMLDAGADVLFIETIFDTLNSKAAIYAVNQLFDVQFYPRVPLFISGTITDKSGRTLSGQTTEAFYTSVRHGNIMSCGLNCALGGKDLAAYVERMSTISEGYVSAYPNAGLPNAMGAYDETPEQMAAEIKTWAINGWVNLVGGCCGSSPPHIAAIAQAVAGIRPRPKGKPITHMMLSGLEVMNVTPALGFLNVGERCNISGSIQFKNLIKAGKYEDALAVAKNQVENGATVLDINLDDGLIDGVSAMTRFINMLGSDPDVSRVPLMIDSSKFHVVEAGLKCTQGKAIVNSISLKVGEEEFIRHATIIKNFGAAAVVMAFDEDGQAADYEAKIRICERSYRILVDKVKFPCQDIIFDPNVLTICTGMPEHNNYAMDFLNATSWIKANLPGAKVSGGLSNLSFSFRGLESIRTAMHSAFLHEAIKNRGMDMAIVNAGALPLYSTIEPGMLKLIEDAIFNVSPEASDALISFAEKEKAIKEAGGGPVKTAKEQEMWRTLSCEERLKHSIINGIVEFIEADVEECRTCGRYAAPLLIIEGPLMDGMGVVGEMFGSGKMFLPQVIKSARSMKKAVNYLTPFMERLKTADPAARRNAGKVLIATVKGDVHDIGKSIVGVVLGCNNYEMIDLGVMCPLEKILKAAVDEKVDIIGLSGLITPSLDEMVYVARAMKRANMNIPLLIGGATTSKMHTAVKIQPAYPNTIHVLDASRSVVVVSQLLGAHKEEFLKDIQEQYEEARAEYAASMTERSYKSLEQARERRMKIDFVAHPPVPPAMLGTQTVSVPLETLFERIDWNPFFAVWQIRGKYPNRDYPKLFNCPHVGVEAKRLFDDVQAMFREVANTHAFRSVGVVAIHPANSVGDDIHVYKDASRTEVLGVYHGLRQQAEKDIAEDPYLCISDFVAPKGINDFVGSMAVAITGCEALCARFEKEGDSYRSIMAKALADRLAEAFAEDLHRTIRREIWGFNRDEQLAADEMHRIRYDGIRPAPGYPAQPDHTEKTTLWKLADVLTRTGIELTESMAMNPASATCAVVLAHPQAKYFAVGKIQKDQIIDYAARKGVSVEDAETLLGSNLSYA